MQSKNDKEEGSQGNQAQKDSADYLSGPQWLPRWLFKALGPITLSVVIVGAATGYYAYYNVTSDSVRFRFWVGFMFSFLAFVVLLVQSVIYAQQAEFMKQQSQAMTDGLERTDKVIKHMEAQVTEMQLQHVTNQGQIMLAVEAVEASKRSAKAAEDSVSVTRDNMVYGQRAYVMVKSGFVQTTGDAALCSLRITNSGNTPANDVRIFAVAEVAANPPVAIDMRAATWTRAGVVAPHTEIIRLVATKEDISSAQWQLMAKEELGLYVWGAVEYKDVFPGTDPHQTKFSLAQRFGGAELGPCDSNNEAF